MKKKNNVPAKLNNFYKFIIASSLAVNLGLGVTLVKLKEDSTADDAVTKAQVRQLVTGSYFAGCITQYIQTNDNASASEMGEAQVKCNNDANAFADSLGTE